MVEKVQKKGLSKGCLVALIVGGILLVMVIVAIVTCYMKRDELAKFAAGTAINSFKEMIIQKPVEGVDTTAFNSILDAFVTKLSEEPLDGEKYSAFFQKIQTIPVDKKIDSVEVGILLDAIFEYYPDLMELPSPLETSDSTGIIDTASAFE